MLKPIYSDYHSKVLDTYSITEAERMMDDEHQNFKNAMQKWWNSLTLEEQKKEYAADTNLSFYVKVSF